MDPAGSAVYPGDDVFGSKIEFYNGLGERIAEDQLSGTILSASVPEPTSNAMLLLGLGGLAVMKLTRKRPSARVSASTPPGISSRRTLAGQDLAELGRPRALGASDRTGAGKI
jgi:PEP-CTERM motif